MATKATSGRSARSRSTRSASASIEITSWPSRSSASSTRAPDRNETWRSSERPPLRTATRLTLVAPTAWQAQNVGEALRRRTLGVGLGRRLRARERAVQADLLAHDLADPPDPLADVLLGRPGEVEPHRRAPAAVDVSGAPRHERDLLAQGTRQEVGGVDVIRQRRPEEHAALWVRPLRLAREVLG